MKLVINIPDKEISKEHCFFVDIRMHFQDGELVEWDGPSGMSLTEQKKPEKLLPCTCGSNMRHLWMNTTPREPSWFYICGGCGRHVYGKNKVDLRRQWNETIRKEVDE